MSMTPDQIYQLSSVGQIPADLKASLVKAESCLDDAKSKFSEFMRG